MTVDVNRPLTQVRPFTPKDEPDCIRLMNEAIGQGFYWNKAESLGTQSFRETTSDEALIVAELAGQVVGFASLYIPDDFLHHLYVDPEFQRKGVGAALLSEVLAMVGSDGSLKCQVQNKVARDFYNAHGWVEDSDIGGRDEMGEWLWLRITKD